LLPKLEQFLRITQADGGSDSSLSPIQVADHRKVPFARFLEQYRWPGCLYCSMTNFRHFKRWTDWRLNSLQVSPLFKKPEELALTMVNGTILLRH